MKMRTASMSRETKETKISVDINLDGSGRSDAATGIGFFDHMLDLLARHALIDLTVRAQGDLCVDGHHTVEDIGIVLGKALFEALGEKRGIGRYGFASIPMDEALATCSLDLSGRAYIAFSANFSSGKVGEMATELIEEFFRSLSLHGQLTMHLSCLSGNNDHHKIEAMFKAFARALRQAVAVDPGIGDAIPSTKGSLT